MYVKYSTFAAQKCITILLFQGFFCTVFLFPDVAQLGIMLDKIIMSMNNAAAEFCACFITFALTGGAAEEEEEAAFDSGSHPPLLTSSTWNDMYVQNV